MQCLVRFIVRYPIGIRAISIAAKYKRHVRYVYCIVFDTYYTHCTLCAVRYTLYVTHCALHIVRYTSCVIHSIIRCTSCVIHSIIRRTSCIIHSIIRRTSCVIHSIIRRTIRRCYYITLPLHRTCRLRRGGRRRLKADF